jgi:hypothetical protein
MNGRRMPETGELVKIKTAGAFSGDRVFSSKKRKGTGATAEADVCYRKKMAISSHIRFFLPYFLHSKREHDNKYKSHTEIHLLQSSNGMVFKPKHPINPAVHPLHC